MLAFLSNSLKLNSMKKKLYLYIILFFLFCIRYEESPDDPTSKEGFLKHYLYIFKITNNDSNTSYTPTKIVMYKTQITYQGNLDSNNDGNSRPEVDQICKLDLPSQYNYLKNIRGFLSISTVDQISDYPTNKGVPTNLPIVGPTDILIAYNWADLLDGTIQNTLDTAIGGFSSIYVWWSGANSDGSVRETCTGWQEGISGFIGGSGNVNATDFTWIQWSVTSCGDYKWLLCIGW